MQYRDLGKTGLKVSAIGLGCVQIGSSKAEYAARLVRRALELGVTFFDVARGYWEAEIHLGLGLEGQRHRAIVSTKTAEKTREGAWREINESLERLRTDYVDNCHLHYLQPGDDVERRLGPGGALEALLRAKEQRMIRHIGCTSHRSDVLLDAIGRFDFEAILVPLNIVEREPLIELIPLCQEKGIGVTVMKPVATGLLPARLALKWLLNQPVATVVPGCTTIEELEENVQVAQPDVSLTPQEEREVQGLREKLEHVRCRLCDRCVPCPQGIEINELLGSDVLYDHYRTMGPEVFRAFPWSRSRMEGDLVERERNMAAIRSCTHCGECEAKCPYGLPAPAMLESMLPVMEDMVSFYHEVLGAG